MWRIWLRPDSDLEERYACLSDEDRARADRFLFDKDRHQLILSHFAQQSILDHYLGTGNWQLERADHGKPRLVGGELEFNLSHAHQLALMAVGTTQLGVDVEYTERAVEYLSLARRFFAADEVAVFEGLTPEQQSQEFFTIWTRKEAYIKAIGDGLSHPLDAFSVNLDRQAPAFHNCPGWSLYELDVPRDYRAALATKGPVLVQMRDFRPR